MPPVFEGCWPWPGDFPAQEFDIGRTGVSLPHPLAPDGSPAEGAVFGAKEAPFCQGFGVRNPEPILIENVANHSLPAAFDSS